MALCKYRGLEKEANAVRTYFFGGNDLIVKAPLNDEMVVILEECLRKASFADSAIRLLPTPPGFQPGAFYGALYVAKLGYAFTTDHLRKMKNRSDRLEFRAFLMMTTASVRYGTVRKMEDAAMFPGEETCPEE